MPSNFNSFLKETQKAIEVEQKKMESEAKKIVIGAYDMITNLSPVDTSLFRHSHIITYNTTTSENPSSVDGGLDGKNKSVVSSGKFAHGDTLTIQTNSVYADALESGHSTQAPLGIYGIAKARTQTIINKRKKI